MLPLPDFGACLAGTLSPHVAASLIDCVELAAIRPEEGSHLHVQRLQTSQIQVWWFLGRLEGDQADAVETLEDPAHWS